MQKGSGKMHLKNVEVSNYCSIEKLSLPLEYGCNILVGLSESGKSNILKSLRTLDSKFVVSVKDIKQGTKVSDEANIDYIVSPETFEVDEFEKIIDNFLIVKDKQKIIKRKTRFLKISDLANTEYSYLANIRTGAREMFYYNLSDIDDYSLLDDLYEISVGDNLVRYRDSSTSIETEIKGNFIIDLSNYELLSDVEKEKVTVESLHHFISVKMMNILEKNIPNVLYWQYNDENLLPSKINIKEFAKNPSINMPLKYIFKLSGIDDLDAEYEEKKQMGETAFQNLLDDVSKNANSYLKKVWKSMPKDATIHIFEVGDEIQIRIQDSKNKYTLNNRSDGFKRLITFMIMLSMKNNNDELKNTLILIDEPESSIDIPGQEYLKRELIHIGENNYIFYSTHSSAMIDTTKISRHYIVLKNEESTEIARASESNYCDAVTLYKALGQETYSIIKKYNVVFEGWMDKKVFQIWGNSIKNGSIKNKYNNIGQTHIQGVFSARNFAQFWGMYARKYFILSDSDDEAVQAKEIYEIENYEGEWIMYSDLFDKRKIKTLEDFIEPKHIKNICDKYSDSNQVDKKIDLAQLEDDTLFNIDIIKNWIESIYGKGKNNKEEIKQIKYKIIESVTKSKIRDDYKIFFENLVDKVTEK